MLETIFEWLTQALSGCVEAFVDTFMTALDFDIGLLAEKFPVLATAYDIFQFTALGITISIAAVNLVRYFGGQMAEIEETPISCVFRGLIAGALIFAGGHFLEIIINLAKKPYSALLSVDATAGGTLEGIAAANNLNLETLSVNVATFSFPLHSGYVIGTAAATLIAFVMICIIAFNLIKVMLEAAQRFVMIGVLLYSCPLAFSTCASRNTMQIFKKWLAMFIGECITMTMSVWLLQAIVSGFSYNPDSPDGYLLKFFLTLALCKIAQKLDNIVSQLGFNNATMGGNILNDILGAAATIGTGANMVMKASKKNVLGKNRNGDGNLLKSQGTKTDADGSTGKGNMSGKTPSGAKANDHGYTVPGDGKKKSDVRDKKTAGAAVIASSELNGSFQEKANMAGRASADIRDNIPGAEGPATVEYDDSGNPVLGGGLTIADLDETGNGSDASSAASNTGSAYNNDDPPFGNEEPAAPPAAMKPTDTHTPQPSLNGTEGDVPNKYTPIASSYTAGGAGKNKNPKNHDSSGGDTRTKGKRTSSREQKAAGADHSAGGRTLGTSADPLHVNVNKKGTPKGAGGAEGKKGGQDLGTAENPVQVTAHKTPESSPISHSGDHASKANAPEMPAAASGFQGAEGMPLRHEDPAQMGKGADAISKASVESNFAGGASIPDNDTPVQNKQAMPAQSGGVFHNEETPTTPGGINKFADENGAATIPGNSGYRGGETPHGKSPMQDGKPDGEGKTPAAAAVPNSTNIPGGMNVAQNDKAVPTQSGNVFQGKEMPAASGGTIKTPNDSGIVKEPAAGYQSGVGAKTLRNDDTMQGGKPAGDGTRKSPEANITAGNANIPGGTTPIQDNKAMPAQGGNVFQGKDMPAAPAGSNIVGDSGIAKGTGTPGFAGNTEGARLRNEDPVQVGKPATDGIGKTPAANAASGGAVIPNSGTPVQEGKTMPAQGGNVFPGKEMPVASGGDTKIPGNSGIAKEPVATGYQGNTGSKTLHADDTMQGAKPADNGVSKMSAASIPTGTVTPGAAAPDQNSKTMPTQGGNVFQGKEAPMAPGGTSRISGDGGIAKESGTFGSQGGEGGKTLRGESSAQGSNPVSDGVSKTPAAPAASGAATTVGGVQTPIQDIKTMPAQGGSVFQGKEVPAAPGGATKPTGNSGIEKNAGASGYQGGEGGKTLRGESTVQDGKPVTDGGNRVAAANTTPAAPSAAGGMQTPVQDNSKTMSAQGGNVFQGKDIPAVPNDTVKPTNSSGNAKEPGAVGYQTGAGAKTLRGEESAQTGSPASGSIDNRPAGGAAPGATNAPNTGTPVQESKTMPAQGGNVFQGKETPVSSRGDDKPVGSSGAAKTPGTAGYQDSAEGKTLRGEETVQGSKPGGDVGHKTPVASAEHRGSDIPGDMTQRGDDKTVPVQNGYAAQQNVNAPAAAAGAAVGAAGVTATPDNQQRAGGPSSSSPASPYQSEEGKTLNGETHESTPARNVGQNSDRTSSSDTNRDRGGMHQGESVNREASPVNSREGQDKNSGSGRIIMGDASSVGDHIAANYSKMASVGADYPELLKNTVNNSNPFMSESALMNPEFELAAGTPRTANGKTTYPNDEVGSAMIEKAFGGSVATDRKTGFTGVTAVNMPSVYDQNGNEIPGGRMVEADYVGSGNQAMHMNVVDGDGYRAISARDPSARDKYKPFIGPSGERYYAKEEPAHRANAQRPEQRIRNSGGSQGSGTDDWAGSRRNERGGSGKFGGQSYGQAPGETSFTDPIVPPTTKKGLGGKTDGTGSILGVQSGTSATKENGRGRGRSKRRPPNKF